jgi:hypothetical protein
MMNRDIMILILEIVGNGIRTTIDEWDEESESETLARLEHILTICDHNLERL